MADKKEAVKKEEGKKVTYTCVCDNEWRGSHDNGWGDCVCYRDDEGEAKK